MGWPKIQTRSCHLKLGWALSLKDLCRLTRVLHGIQAFHDLEQSDSNSTHPGSSWTLFHSHNVSSTTELTSKVLTKMGQILLSVQDWYILLCDRCNDREPFHSCVLMRTVVNSTLKMSRGE